MCKNVWKYIQIFNKVNFLQHLRDRHIFHAVLLANLRMLSLRKRNLENDKLLFHYMHFKLRFYFAFFQ